jgi:hypothetical protein
MTMHTTARRSPRQHTPRTTNVTDFHLLLLIVCLYAFIAIWIGACSYLGLPVALARYGTVAVLVVIVGAHGVWNAKAPRMQWA